MEVRDDTDEITIVAAKNVHPGPTARYYTLHQNIEKSEHFEAVFVNDHAPPDARRRYDYMKGLVVHVSASDIRTLVAETTPLPVENST